MSPFIVISLSIITLDFREFINNFENPPVIIILNFSFIKTAVNGVEKILHFI